MLFLKRARFNYAKKKILNALKDDKDYVLLPKSPKDMSMKEKIMFFFFISPDPIKMSCKAYLDYVMNSNQLTFEDIKDLWDEKLANLK